MKAYELAIVVVMIAAYAYPIHAGIRCENDIISVGDTKAVVVIKLSKCGEVLFKEVVRKETHVSTDKNESDDKVKKEKVKKEKMIEIWYIRVKERGSMYCYPLTFEEGCLQSIGRWSRCD